MPAYPGCPGKRPLNCIVWQCCCNDVAMRRRSAVGKHSAAAAGSGVSTTTASTASGLKLLAMSSSSGHDDATPDAPSAGASAAATTASASAPADDAAVSPDVASVEPGAVSAAGQHRHCIGYFLFLSYLVVTTTILVRFMTPFDCCLTQLDDKRQSNCSWMIVKQPSNQSWIVIVTTTLLAHFWNHYRSPGVRPGFPMENL